MLFFSSRSDLDRNGPLLGIVGITLKKIEADEKSEVERWCESELECEGERERGRDSDREREEDKRKYIRGKHVGEREKSK